MTVDPKAISAGERPRNGLAGLEHWRYDLRSGIMVAMISLPFSMGIAITSGAPPVCGIVSAIIAGFVLPFLGGSFVTISGPAAGLAPALYAGIISLGSAVLGAGAPQDDILRRGYPLVLVAICLAGAVQIVLARLRVARLSTIFPAAAIEGMLAAIGLLITAKQIPLFLGVKFEAHEFWEILQETPGRLGAMNGQVFGLGAASLGVLFLLGALPWRGLRIMPPPVWIFVAGTAVSYLWLDLGPDLLINIPEAPLKNGVVFPDFAGVFGTAGLWFPLAYLVVTLVLIDGTESLATIFAVDKLDPYRRRSDPDRTLLAMGVSNIGSSVLGGLTIIPGIVKSTANILGGGRTQWANFFNACALLLFLTLGRDLINLVPKVVLAAILVFIGFKLCRPRVWRHVARIGVEQLVVFAVTVLATVSTDLLIGIIAGVVVELLFSLWFVDLWHKLSATPDHARPGPLSLLGGLFRNPVGRRDYTDGVYHLHFRLPMVCFNLMHVIREFERIPGDAREVHLHLTEDVTCLDHTTIGVLRHYLHEFASDGTRPHLRITGLEQMRPLSNHEAGSRLAKIRPESSEKKEGEVGKKANEVEDPGTE